MLIKNVENFLVNLKYCKLLNFECLKKNISEFCSFRMG